MAGSVLVDAGFLVALLSRRDAHHGWAAALSPGHPPPWRTCDAVLSEAFHLLGTRGGAALAGLLKRRAVVVGFDLGEQMDPVLMLMGKYAGVPDEPRRCLSGAHVRDAPRPSPAHDGCRLSHLPAPWPSGYSLRAAVVTMTKSRAAAEHAVNASHGEAESAYAWTRLLAALLLSTIGGVGMWSVIVALPAVQAEFGVARSDASLPYTMTMIGVGVGGVLMGRLSDRFGISCRSRAGRSPSASATSRRVRRQISGIHPGSGPVRGRRQLRDVRAASRRHLALVHPPSGHGRGHLCERQLSRGHGRPPIIQRLIEGVGWRQAHVGIALFCAVSMLPLTLVLRRRSPLTEPDHPRAPCPIEVAATARVVAARAAGRARHRRSELLRRDVDAAGPHRRVLGRSRPRRGARRGCCLSCWASAW